MTEEMKDKWRFVSFLFSHLPSSHDYKNIGKNVISIKMNHSVKDHDIENIKKKILVMLWSWYFHG